MVKKWGGLEYFKFAVYIIMPISCSLYILDNDRLNNLIKKYQFVVYPPELHAPEDVKNMIREAAIKREQRLAANQGIEEQMQQQREEKHQQFLNRYQIRKEQDKIVAQKTNEKQQQQQQ
ncbi:hypothetical protein PPL_03732 [Heterostelium album PN500]|uniref:Uncharacterized protein n=1 Tax=Heterostelium pallidum (strain ATCC 26659 / Pp 5 / PN500) TaxID=670386 RepID=D3B6I4_HETP5|nr:hypothetical protein PPL_03732 [Heterostelium album PN500]EFA82954.1 hypothetical protein PPL_03732 [Heterostelium album PN500]|eukprot:XP_020435071.1 hypothetical protein PPL_03732 [Heterostelium album PN500]